MAESLTPNYIAIFMKRIRTFLVITTMLLIVGCGNRIKQVKIVDEPLMLEVYMGNFMARHKDFGTNDLTRKIAATDFIKEIKDTLYKVNLLEGVPMKLSTINKTKGGKVMAQFEAWHAPYNFEYKNGIDYICADIIGVVADTIATKLKQGGNEYYILKGCLIDFITYETACLLMETNMTTLTNKVDLDEPSSSISNDDNKYVPEFGIMFYQIDKIDEFEGRKQKREEIEPNTYSKNE